MKVILASASPRRRELLGNLKIDFEVKTADCEEEFVEGEHPKDTVMRLSKQKAVRVSDMENSECPVIGADTVVAIDGKILGKPKDEAEAADMLRTLSGRTHTVYTGVTVIVKGGKTVTEFEATDVTFRVLSDRQIRNYISTGEPMDKAGAYGIQKYGSLLVERINGDYFNVVGLPLCRLSRILSEKFGIEPLV